MEDHIELIENYLNELSDKHGLGEVKYHKVVDGEEVDEIFYIKVPKTIRTHERPVIWNVIVDDTKKFCEEKNITDKVGNIGIILK